MTTTEAAGAAPSSGRDNNEQATGNRRKEESTKFNEDAKREFAEGEPSDKQGDSSASKLSDESTSAEPKKTLIGCGVRKGARRSFVGGKFGKIINNSSDTGDSVSVNNERGAAASSCINEPNEEDAINNNSNHSSSSSTASSASGSLSGSTKQVASKSTKAASANIINNKSSAPGGASGLQSSPNHHHQHINNHHLHHASDDQNQSLLVVHDATSANSAPASNLEPERRYRPQKYCAVCGDKAIACNFNAVTCESCKAFFRRNAFKEQRLKCLFDNRCVIDRVTRRFCSKCRLLKCFQIGMKREWILTDEQKQIKRVKIMQNKQIRSQQMATSTNTSPQQQQVQQNSHNQPNHLLAFAGLDAAGNVNLLDHHHHQMIQQGGHDQALIDYDNVNLKTTFKLEIQHQASSSHQMYPQHHHADHSKLMNGKQIILANNDTNDATTNNLNDDDDDDEEDDGGGDNDDEQDDDENEQDVDDKIQYRHRQDANCTNNNENDMLLINNKQQAPESSSAAAKSSAMLISNSHKFRRRIDDESSSGASQRKSTRDASTSCTLDEFDLAGHFQAAAAAAAAAAAMHTPIAYCSFAAECRFCSVRVLSATPNTNAQHPHLHQSHHHHQLQQANPHQHLHQQHQQQQLQQQQQHQQHQQVTHRTAASISNVVNGAAPSVAMTRGGPSNQSVLDYTRNHHNQLNNHIGVATSAAATNYLGLHQAHHPNLLNHQHHHHHAQTQAIQTHHTHHHQNHHHLQLVTAATNGGGAGQTTAHHLAHSETLQRVYSNHNFTRSLSRNAAALAYATTTANQNHNVLDQMQAVDQAVELQQTSNVGECCPTNRDLLQQQQLFDSVNQTLVQQPANLISQHQPIELVSTSNSAIATNSSNNTQAAPNIANPPLGGVSNALNQPPHLHEMRVAAGQQQQNQTQPIALTTTESYQLNNNNSLQQQETATQTTTTTNSQQAVYMHSSSGKFGAHDQRLNQLSANSNSQQQQPQQIQYHAVPGITGCFGPAVGPFDTTGRGFYNQPSQSASGLVTSSTSAMSAPTSSSSNSQGKQIETDYSGTNNATTDGDNEQMSEQQVCDNEQQQQHQHQVEIAKHRIKKFKTRMVNSSTGGKRDISSTSSTVDQSPATSPQQQSRTQNANSLTATTSSNAQTNDDNFITWKQVCYRRPVTSEEEMRRRIEALDFSQNDRMLIDELVAATRFIFEQREYGPRINSVTDVVRFCDDALKGLIKKVKQIRAFKVLSIEDQITLSKTACFKILLLRSSFHYSEAFKGWVDVKTGKVMELEILNGAKNSLVYEKHKQFINMFPIPLRKDRFIMSLLTLALLFDPNTLRHNSKSIIVDNIHYLNMLKTYLNSTQPEPLKKYETLVEVMEAVNVCNEEYNNFFSKDFQRDQMTPLLIEIFDIPLNSNSL